MTMVHRPRKKAWKMEYRMATNLTGSLCSGQVTASQGVVLHSYQWHTVIFICMRLVYVRSFLHHHHHLLLIFFFFFFLILILLLHFCVLCVPLSRLNFSLWQTIKSLTDEKENCRSAVCKHYFLSYTPNGIVMNATEMVKHAVLCVQFEAAQGKYQIEEEKICQCNNTS